MAAWRVQLFLPVISDHENVRETGRMENGDGAGGWGRTLLRNRRRRG